MCWKTNLLVETHKSIPEGNIICLDKEILGVRNPDRTGAADRGGTAPNQTGASGGPSSPGLTSMDGC